MAGQSIRRSQFITTYGPGAILEGPQGPRVIPTLGESGLFGPGRRAASDFEITDRRLSAALLHGASIVYLPSNAQLNLPESQELYATLPFPSWSLCARHRVVYHRVAGGADRRACPRCEPLAREPDAWDMARRQAIRFVMACPSGHMNDVNWAGLPQHRRPDCRPAYLEWRGAGSALASIQIVCPSCGGAANLGAAYNRDWPCSGRRPEMGTGRGPCPEKARMLQRGAANLRMAELHTALTIPPADTRLHRLLELGAIRAAVATDPPRDRAHLLEKVAQLVRANLLGATVERELAGYPSGEVLAALEQLAGTSLPPDDRTLRAQEFDALLRASVDGAPAQPSSIRGGPPQFEVDPYEVREIPGPRRRHLRITPISRLRVVMVQTGYRRLDPLASTPVDCAYVDEGDRSWYPGVELYGEGLFITLAPGDLRDGRHFPLVADLAWLQAWQAPDRFKQRVQTTLDADSLHPVFVWWHTLAHRLINALSIDSGYSSAAVRERVYVSIDAEGRGLGGILLYTAQPGGDGTLGGMIALVPTFERVLHRALHTIDACSNDPLCGEEEFRSGKSNGPACYACQLVSETSCEVRNTRLDRRLLLENVP